MTDRASRIAEITERVGKATPGEWKSLAGNVYAAGKGGGNVCTVGEPRATTVVEYTKLSIGSADIDEAWANADFIANCKQDIPFLLSEITRLQAELSASEERVKEARKVALEEAAKVVLAYADDQSKTVMTMPLYRAIRNLAQEGETK